MIDRVIDVSYSNVSCVVSLELQQRVQRLLLIIVTSLLDFIASLHGMEYMIGATCKSGRALSLSALPAAPALGDTNHITLAMTISPKQQPCHLEVLLCETRSSAENSLLSMPTFA